MQGVRDTRCLVAASYLYSREQCGPLVKVLRGRNSSTTSQPSSCMSTTLGLDTVEQEDEVADAGLIETEPDFEIK